MHSDKLWLSLQMGLNNRADMIPADQWHSGVRTGYKPPEELRWPPEKGMRATGEGTHVAGACRAAGSVQLVLCLLVLFSFHVELGHTNFVKIVREMTRGRGCCQTWI